MIDLGSKTRDIISGFEGIVTGRAQYLTGCTQYLVVPARTDKDGKRIDGEWYDEMRLKVLEGPTVEIVEARDRFAAAQPGGPSPSEQPSRRG